jgi:hypothetical protein
MSELDDLITWEPAEGIHESIKNPMVGSIPGRCSFFVVAGLDRRVRLANRKTCRNGEALIEGSYWTWFDYDGDYLRECLRSGTLPESFGSPLSTPDYPTLYLIAMGALKAGFTDMEIVAAAVKYRGLMEKSS